MHKLKWFQVVIALIIGVVFSVSEKMSANELSFGVQIETSEYQRHATAGSGYFFTMFFVRMKAKKHRTSSSLNNCSHDSQTNLEGL